MVEYDNLVRVKQRMVIAGNHLELYTPEKPYWLGYPSVSRSQLTFEPVRKYANHVLIKKPIDEIRNDNLKKCRQTVRRITDANTQFKKFWTLTYPVSVEHRKDIKKCRKDLKNCILRVERYFNFKFSYLEVVEFQENDSVHFHIVCNLPFIPKSDLHILDDLWGFGDNASTVKLLTDKHRSYITKYMTKELFDGRLFCQKKFTRSNDLILPEVVYNDDVDEYLADLCKQGVTLKIEFVTDVSSQWRGNTHYEKIYVQRDSSPPN
jgi:hypothetical protein